MPWHHKRQFFFLRYGAAHCHAQEPTPGSAVQFRGKVSARTAPWFGSQTLPVPRHGGGGVHAQWIHPLALCTSISDFEPQPFSNAVTHLLLCILWSLSKTRIGTNMLCGSGAYLKTQLGKTIYNYYYGQHKVAWSHYARSHMEIYDATWAARLNSQFPSFQANFELRFLQPDPRGHHVTTTSIIEVPPHGLNAASRSQAMSTSIVLFSPRKLHPVLRAERAEKDRFATGQTNYFFGCLMNVILDVVK